VRSRNARWGAGLGQNSETELVSGKPCKVAAGDGA
jgi:hypothetical protein